MEFLANLSGSLRRMLVVMVLAIAAYLSLSGLLSNNFGVMALASTPVPSVQTTLVVPTASVNNLNLTVASGDTMTGIAKANCWDYATFRTANAQVSDPNKIVVNQQLNALPAVPGCSPSNQQASTPVKAVNTALVTTTVKPNREAVWDKVAQCESSGNWSINTGNGYYGGLQFSASTWRAFGGAQFASTANKASKAEQIAIAEKVLIAQGSGAWPVCSLKANLAAIA